MSAQTVIRNFMSTLDATTLSGTAALDQAVASVSNFKSWSELIKTMAGDCAAYAGNGSGFLQDKCGIILSNSDTGAISGSDAGGSVTKTAESVVPESGDWTYPPSSSFTVSGLTVNINNFDNLGASEQWIVGALYTWWVKESLALIDSSFGMNFNEAGTTVKTLNVYFYNSDDGKMAISNYSATQKSTELRLNINMHYYEKIDMTNPNGVGSSAALNTLDRTIAHELTHAVMSANVDYYSNLPVSFKEGAAELVHGIDDKRYNQIVVLSNDASALQSAMTQSGMNSYAAGYIALRYLAKQAAEGRVPSAADIATTTTDPVAAMIDTTGTATSTTAATIDTAQATKTTLPPGPVHVTVASHGDTLTIVGPYETDVFLGGVNIFTGQPAAYGNETMIVLDAADMTTAHFLAGNLNSNYIITGYRGSTVWGGAGGDDIIQGGRGRTPDGNGRDNFWYFPGNGNDTALNFKTGTDSSSDMLSFIGWGVTHFYRDQNVVTAFMADGGTFTAVTDDYTADKIINFSADGFNPLYTKIGRTNVVNDFMYEGDGIVYMGGNNIDALHVATPGASVNLADGFYSGIEVIDASTAHGSTLFGDALNNIIISGGDNSALWGGAGDDVIYGGTGTDYFLFGAGEGNDVFCNVGDDDLITLYNAMPQNISFATETDSGLLLGVGSNVLAIVSQSNTAIAFADGTAIRYDRSAKTWTSA